MAWYDSNWSYRIPVTIDSTKVSADLTDFPVYVDLSDLSADFFSNVKTDGSDIRVTKDDGTTEVPREVVAIDTGSSTGELHFKADGTLSSSTDTDFYIYYGNASATEPAVTATYGRNNVWTDYDGVYHLQGNATNSAGTSYSELMDGTSSSSGKIYGAYDFDGTSDELITNYTGFSGTSTFGLSMWFNKGSGGGTSPMLAGVSSTLGSTYEIFYLMLANSKTNVQVAIKAGSSSYTDITTNTTTINAGTWYYNSCWYDGSNLYNKINNGTAASTTATGSLNTSTSDGLDFANWKGQSQYQYDGLLDEIRFTTTPKNDNWYSTEYNNQNSASTFYSAGAQEEASPIPWYDSSWTYRQKITIDNTKVSADLTDFPVYVDLSDLGTDFFSNVKTDGSDIRVTKSDGTTEVPREVVGIDTGSSTGELHFKADGTLSSSTSTSFYIYYGNASATEPATSATYGRNNVWSSYICVYHMAQDPSGSAPQMIDSTGNGNDLTSSGSMTSGDLVSGQVGNAIDFDGSNDYLGINYNSDFDLTNSDLTISLLVKTSSSGSYRQIVSKMGSSTSDFNYQLGIQNSNKAYFTTGSGGSWTDATGTSNINTGTWKYLVGTKVHAGNSKVYVDGTQEANVSSVNIGNSTNVPITVGARSNTGTRSQFFPAQIDEVRLSANALSADFIDAMVTNHTSASTFYSAAAQETYTPSATFIPKITSVL